MISRLLAARFLLRSKHLNNVGTTISLQSCTFNAATSSSLPHSFAPFSLGTHCWSTSLGSLCAMGCVRQGLLAGKPMFRSGLQLFVRTEQSAVHSGGWVFSWRPLIPTNRGGFRLSTLRPHSGRMSFWDPDAVLWGLIGVNTVVYCLWKFGNYKFMRAHFMVSVDNLMSGRMHTLLTSAFSHKDIYHLLFNMLGLYFFGREIALNFGGRHLLLLYIAGGVAGSLGHIVYCCYILPWLKGVPRTFYYSRYSLPALGASGAVNAIVVFDILLNPRRVILVDFLFPVPAILFGAYLVLKDLWGTTRVDSETAHAGHLGGALVGAAAWMQYRSRWR